MLGRALAWLVLTSHQCDIMHRSPPRVMLTGPPGTGMKPCSSFLESFNFFNFVFIFLCQSGWSSGTVLGW